MKVNKIWIYNLALVSVIGTAFGLGYKYHSVLDSNSVKLETELQLKDSKLQVISVTYDFESEKQKLETYEDMVYRVAVEYNIDPSVVIAIGQVESRSRNLVGDKHMKNKAYGYFQIRQPAVDEVNKKFGFQGVERAEELLIDLELQVRYCCMYLSHLVDLTGSIDDAIQSYNIGYTNWKSGKTNDYPLKVKSFMN